MESNETSLMWIYEAVRIKLGTLYPNIMYQNMLEDKEGCVGIYLYESSNELKDIEGDVVYDSIKIHVQVNAEKSIQGMQKALDYLDKFTRKMENEQSNVGVVKFIEAQHLGPRAVAIGKNAYDILVCKCDVDLKYIFIADDND